MDFLRDLLALIGAGALICVGIFIYAVYISVFRKQ